MTTLGNLQRKYPEAFLAQWPGCADRDCLPECRQAHAHCERLKRAFAEFEQSEFQRTEGDR